MNFLRRLMRQTERMPGWDEWIIVGPAELRELVERELRPEVHFITADLPVGEARNVCADAAQDGVIVQLDDDDWHASHRVVRQLQLLRDNPRKRMVGNTWIYALFAATGDVARVPIWSVRGMLPGCTLAYRREAWKSHPYVPGTRHPLIPGMAEDGDFTSYFYDRAETIDARDPSMLVYLRHAQNVSVDWFTEPPPRKMTPYEVLEERRRNPSRPMRVFDYDEPIAAERLRLHNSEVYSAYVQHLMGDEFSSFLDPNPCAERTVRTRNVP